MEDREEADPDMAAVAPQSPPPPTWKSSARHPAGKKRRRNVNPLRVALFLFRRHARAAGSKDPLHAQAVKPGARGLWKTLLAAVHPLRHGPRLLEPAIAAPPASAAVPSSARDSGVAFASAPPSPTTPDDDDDDDGGMSRYASANDLRELDAGAGTDGDQEEGDDDDHAIDARAEEFIAKFYEQMRLQQLQSSDGH